MTKRRTVASKTRSLESYPSQVLLKPRNREHVINIILLMLAVIVIIVVNITGMPHIIFSLGKTQYSRIHNISPSPSLFYSTLSISLWLWTSVCLYLSPCFCLSLSIYVFHSLSFTLTPHSIYISIYLSVCLSISLSLSLSLSFSLFLSLSFSRFHGLHYIYRVFKRPFIFWCCLR